MFDFSVVTNWVNDLLTSVMPQWLATTIECVIVGALLLLGYTVLAMFYIMYERWVRLVPVPTWTTACGSMGLVANFCRCY